MIIQSIAISYCSFCFSFSIAAHRREPDSAVKVIPRSPDPPTAIPDKDSDKGLGQGPRAESASLHTYFHPAAFFLLSSIRSHHSIMTEYLPLDILHEVFSYLDPVNDRRELSSLCYVSRVFKQLAQPLLFRAFGTEKQTSSSSSQINDFDRLILFARTVLTRLDLQDAVHQMTIRAEGVPMYNFDSGSLTDTDILLADAIRELRFGKQWKETDIDNVFSGMIDPLLILLIANPRRLETLSVVFHHESMEGLLQVLEPEMSTPETAAVAASYFSNIIWLDLTVVPGKGLGLKTIDLYQVLPLLCLPRLQHFGVNHCIGHSEDLSSGLPPGSVNASSISLRDSCFSQEVLTSIMGACKCIRSLTYTARTALFKYVHPGHMSPEEFMQAVDSQKSNLTSLHVGFDELHVDIMTWEFDSLDSLKNLRHAQFEQGCLMEKAELPRSLETLVLDSCVWPVFDTVCFLAKESKTRLQSLKRVALKESRLGFSTMFGLRLHTEEFAAHVRKLEAIAANSNFKLAVEHKQYKGYLREIVIEDDDILKMIDEEDGGFLDTLHEGD